MGAAVMYMLLLLAQVVVLIYLAAFAAHCFLVVVENTAAGNDRVRWPDEPVYDWLWKPPYLVWLVAFSGLSCSRLLARVIGSLALASALAVVMASVHSCCAALVKTP